MRKYRITDAAEGAEINAIRNVDRLFALWQAIYPNATVTPQVNAAGSFTEDPGTTEDINTRQSASLAFDEGL